MTLVMQMRMQMRMQMPPTTTTLKMLERKRQIDEAIRMIMHDGEA